MDCVVCLKTSHLVRLGDMVDCTIAELQPLRAEPEDIPLDIVYEDENVIVVNKPAHMVRSQLTTCSFRNFWFAYFVVKPA